MLNPADADFLAALRTVVPPETVRDAEPRYLEEPRGVMHGHAAAVATPENTEHVAAIVRLCNAHRVGIVPYGGGTGLVGGQVMPDGPAPLLITTEKMTRIRAVWSEENAMVAEAGAILADVHHAAEEAGRLFPLSLASEGSARIGGLLSTNAGGVNVLRYGNAREQVLGLEAVLPDGSIWNGLRRLRKDNTGYDLRHLLMGAEGTLGIITAAALKLSPRPAAEGTAVMVVPGPAQALTLLAMARDQIGEGISAFELISGVGLDFLTEHFAGLRQPFAERPDWMVLIELGLPKGLNPHDQLETLFASAFEAELVTDGLIAQSDTQRQDFWNVRETIPLANRKVGAVSSQDIALPLSVIPEFMAKGQEVIAKLGSYRINAFGHLGDGNLHFNIFPPKGEAKADHAHMREIVKYAIHDLVHEFDGSISAEHGIGRFKVRDLERYGDPAKLAAMRAIKAALDPKGIMNPGAVLAQ